MGTENKASIAAWLREHTAIDGSGQDAPRYARLKVGRQRKSADVVWRRDLPGTETTVVAGEILDRFSRISANEKAWIEIVEKGGKGSVDMLPLGSPENSDDAGETTTLADIDPESMGPNAMVAVVVNALVQTNGQLAAESRAKDERYHDLLGKHIDAAARATASETLLTWIDKHGLPGQGGDDMGRALEHLAPVIGPAIAHVMSRMGQPKEGGPPPTPEQRVDRMLTDAESVWASNPDAFMRPEVLMRLGALAQQIQTKAQGAVNG